MYNASHKKLLHKDLRRIFAITFWPESKRLVVGVAPGNCRTYNNAMDIKKLALVRRLLIKLTWLRREKWGWLLQAHVNVFSGMGFRR